MIQNFNKEVQNKTNSPKISCVNEQNSEKQVISYFNNKVKLDKNNNWVVKGNEYNQFVFISVSDQIYFCSSDYLHKYKSIF